MRRSVFKALATVSLAALVGVATSSQAMTSQALGALKQTDKWKVGIVDPEGQSFCAMVNRFEQNIGLAFALSPEGYGSVAVDVANETFSPGKTYDVTLKTNGKTISTFSGRATSARSIVVQVGQNAAFYDALKANAKLGIGMQQLDAEFSLNKFAPSYSQLIDCAHTLTTGVNGKDGKMPAVKVKDVEKAALAPLDKELAELSGQQVADARGARNDKAAAFDDADDSDAAIEVASAAPAKSAPVAVIGGQKPKTEEKTAEAKPADAVVERKLLASSKATPAAVEVPPADTGATARQWDERQSSDAGRTRIAVLEHLKEEQQQPAVKPDIKFDTPAVETTTVTMQKQVAVTAPAPILPAPITAKPAIAKSGPALVMTSSNDDAALKASLAKKQAEIAQLSAAAAERDALKKQLDAAKSDAEFAKARTALLQGQMLAAAAKSQKSATDKAQMDALQSQLAASEKQRQALETRLAEVGQQSKALNATLDQKQKELAKTAAGEKEIAAMKAEIARMQSGDAATIAELQKQMLAQKEQNESLRQQYAALEQKNQQIAMNAQTALSQKHDSIRQELTRKEAYVSELEQRLAKLEAEHAETSTRAEQAQAALAAAQKDAKVARKSLVIINDDVVVPHVAAEVSAKAVAQATAKAAEKARADAAAHDAELSDARSRINALEQELNATRAKAQTIAAATPAPDQKQAQVEDQRGKLATAQEEIDRLKMKNAELAGRLYNEAAEGRDNTAQNETLKGQRKQLEEAQALIERLKSENEKLAEKAAAPAPAAAPVQVANAADKALIDRLKSENEALATKLSTISNKDEDRAAQQELAQSRARIAQLESQLSETREQQVAQLALPAPIAPRSYVNAPVTPMTPVVSSPAVSSPVVAAPVMAAATPVTTPLPSRKPGNRTVVASAEKSVDVTRDILGIEPAAGDTDPLPALNEEWVEQAPAIHSAQAVAPAGKTVAVKTAAAKPAAAREEAAPIKQPTFFERISAPVAPVTAPTPSFFDRLAQKQAAAEAHRPVPAETTAAAPAASAAPVFAAPAASADPGFDHNRAAAFLDRIMQQHRPGGAPQASSSADKAPVFAPVRRSAAPAIAPQNGSLSAIETAAGPAHASGVPTGYSATPVNAGAEDFPAPVTAAVAPTLASAPVKQPSAAPALETLLASAGISASPSAPQKDAQGSTIRQWTSEGISGMFEQIPAHNAFQANVASYIDRYREDCPALQTSIGAPVQAAAGSVAQADIFCPTAGNTYSTTFVFWQDRASFSALLHSGYPDDAQKVKAMGAGIVSALGAQSAGPASVQAARSADAYVAPVADRQERRFNIPQQSTAAYTGGGEYATRPQGGAPHSFETVVIE